MVRHKKPILGLIIVLFLGLFTECTKREPIVARIGRKDVVTLDEYKKFFSEGKSLKVSASLGLPYIKRHLERMIDQRLEVLAAYEAGLDKDSSVVEKIKSIQKEQMIRRLYETEIIDYVVKESDIRDFYARTGKEVIIRKIFFHIPPTAKPELREKVKGKADSVLQRIRAGEDFASLARKYSKDKKSGMRGGLVGGLSWTRSNDPVRQAAFSMEVGEVSGLITHSGGYNIIKVEEIRKKERKPYNQAREEIRQMLMQENIKKIRDQARFYSQDLKSKNRLEWFASELDTLLDCIKMIKDPRRNILVDSLGVLNPELKKKVLVQYRGGVFSVQDFQENLKTIPKNSVISLTKKKIKSIIEGKIMEDLLLEVAKKKGLDKDRIVVETMKDAMEHEMVRLLNERDIVGEIQPTEKELEDYYEKNKNAKYIESEKVKVQEVMVEDEAVALKIAGWAKAGRDFGKLARAYTERFGFKEKEGILDYFPRGRWGAVGDKAFDMHVGEIAGPISLGNNRGYSIIKLIDKKPVKVKSFRDVREIVIRDFRDDVLKKRQKLWLVERREAQNIQIYEQVLEKALIEKS